MRWTSILVLAIAACGGDDTVDGTRAQCAEGGTLNDCDQEVVTPEDACWRMVDCGAIALREPENYQFDWDRCVSDIERMRDIQQELVLACIRAATCDQLKDENENGRRPCFLLGEN